MDIEMLRSYCLSKIGVTEDMPFDECALTFKVAGKIFAITNVCNFESVNLKYYPEQIEELRAENDAVQPGYHMNKKHWNTIDLGLTHWKELVSWIDISYDLVYGKLPKKVRTELQQIE